VVVTLPINRSDRFYFVAANKKKNNLSLNKKMFVLKFVNFIAKKVFFYVGKSFFWFKTEHFEKFSYSFDERQDK